jgi:hypothetical protein
MAFLLSEELRICFPHRYWPLIAEILELRFPADKAWCTPSKLSRAVGQLKQRIGNKKATGTVEAYRHWFKRLRS